MREEIKEKFEKTLKMIRLKRVYKYEISGRVELNAELVPSSCNKDYKDYKSMNLFHDYSTSKFNLPYYNQKCATSIAGKTRITKES